ncbi:sensor histidine kinase [Lysinibacter cavernae]|uniref:histidine kinase n=1 Tax=Lysinibacter cavernae TaxID=1640652 RepID=A0A7X5TTI6_9MICO|nr:histidine kinase [Lysinibacter cavernae]NIH53318.1 signal transduction histidine kinase [Lysinibacter cavernae]
MITWAGFGTIILLGSSLLLFWRHRMPLAVTIVLLGIPLLFPSSPFPGLIALTALIAARRGRHVWILIGVAYVATLLSVIWDIACGPAGLLGQLLTDADGWDQFRSVIGWLIPLIAAVLMVPTLSVGFVRRTTAELSDVRHQSDATARNVAVLHTEVSRERERQEVAREIHDTLASRLSALSLHAGALELTVPQENPEAAAAAKVVRESAQNSLDDLRHVIEVLRNPELGAVRGGGTTLADIGTLIEEAHAQNDRVRSTLFVTDPLTCDPEVAHACFRIVQEGLSNARRHAPGGDVLVEVRGGSGTGLSLKIVNPLLTHGQASSEGGGHGIVGMRERAQLVGGSLSAERALDGTFTVTAWLPWVPAPRTEG